jgi:ribosomal protein S27E
MVHLLEAGFVGYRTTCRLCGRGTWTKQALSPSTPEIEIRPDPRGRYKRSPHRFVCRSCGATAITFSHAAGAKRCGACKMAAARERDRRRAHRERRLAS